MPDLILVVPPGPEAFAEDMEGRLPPMGLFYLKSALSEAGFTSEIVDLALPGVDYEALRSLVAGSRPLAVGFSFVSDMRFESYALIRRLKADFPDQFLVAGGAHPTLVDLDTLNELPELDAIVRGEGERTICNLARRLAEGRDYADLPGLSCRRDGKAVRNPDAERIADLDALASPYQNPELMARYPMFLRRGERSLRTAAMMTSRGCPHKCAFCSTALFWGRKTAFRSVDSVIREMRMLREERGVECFYFLDDTFNLKLERLHELLDRMTAELPGISWLAGVRIDKLDRDLALKMRRAGCIKVTYGVESASQRLVDDLIHKGIDLGRIPLVESWLEEAGIERRRFFIISLPGETREEARKTLRLVKKLGGENTVSILRILPGTEIEAIARERGALKPDFSWSTPDLSQTYLRHLIGSSPIYLENLSWFEICCVLFEWAESGQRFFSIWQQIPRALKDIKTPGDVAKLAVMGVAFLYVKARGLRRLALGEPECPDDPRDDFVTTAKGRQG